MWRSLCAKAMWLVVSVAISIGRRGVELRRVGSMRYTLQTPIFSVEKCQNKKHQNKWCVVAKADPEFSDYGKPVYIASFGTKQKALNLMAQLNETVTNFESGF